MGKFLPKEIITDIVSRLPNETLWECKLVCKPWKKMIVSDPSFTHMHIQHRLRGDRDSSAKVSFIFEPSLSQVNIPFVKRFYCAEFDKGLEKLVSVKDLDLTHTDADDGICYDTLPSSPFSSEPWDRPSGDEIGSYEEIVGSCNGLVCLTISYNIREELYYKPLYVCNPMTRECVVLPRIPVVTDDDEPYDENEHEEWGSFYDGFGYSPSTKECKVVRIYYDEVYVYTLGDGKGWRNIGTKVYKSGLGEYVHGAYTYFDEDRNLVSFDLDDEKFAVLQSPPCFRDWDYRSYRLREDGDCLSIVHKNEEDAYDIWLLKKKELEDSETNKDENNCQSWSWIKEYTLYDDRDASLKTNKKKLIPFAIMKDSEVLSHDTRFFYRHDLKTRTSYPLVGFKKCSCRSIDSAVRHTNSFVSLKALGEKDTTTMIKETPVPTSLLPELTYNIEEEEKTISLKRKERTEEEEMWSGYDNLVVDEDEIWRGYENCLDDDETSSDYEYVWDDY